MAEGKKISELTERSTLRGSEVFPIVTDGQNFKTTLDKMKEYINSGDDFVDGSVTTDKVADGAITEKKLSNDVVEKLNSGGGNGIPDGAVTKQELSSDVQEAIDDVPSLKNQLAGLLWSSAKFAMTADKTVVYVNTNPNVNIKATFTSSDLTPDTITITKPDNSVETFNNTKEARITDTTSRASGNYTFSGKAMVGDKYLPALVVLYVRNAVYKGMGTSYTSIMTDTYKQTATISVADGSYSGKSPANGSKLFLIVPSDVTAPNANEFKMGGSPVVINTSTITIGEVAYTVFETDESYNQGTELNITW